MFGYSSFRTFAAGVACASLAACFSFSPVAYAFQDDGSRAAASDAAKDDQPENRLATPTIPARPERGTAVSDEAEKKQGAETLKRRAGEKVGADPRGQALTLGMKLQEGDKALVKVVEVAAASPAFDAGIRGGDLILSYHGFSADTYRKWIDGMNRLTSESQPGARIPVVVERNGKRMSLALRVPDRPVRTPTSVALAQKANQLAPGTAGPAVAIPSGSTLPPRGGGGGSDVLIDNSGGNFFGDQSASPNEGAIAHIFRLNAPPPANPATAAAGAPAAGGTTAGGAQNTTVAPVPAPPGGGARIGMAGFRDDPSGMVVMVDVGALAPGNYVVGIGDASAVQGITPGGVTPMNPPANAPLPTNAPVNTPPAGQSPQAPQPAPGTQPRVPSDAPIEPPAVPAPAQPATGANQRQSNLPATSNGLIPRTVLAQVSATTPTSNSPATDGASTANAQSGTVNPAATTRTGQSGVNNAQRSQASQTGTDGSQTDTGAGTGAGSAASGAALNEIGTLTVDQSGTGRMQQTVEGVQVRNVVGQSIVIYSTVSPQQKTAPPNLNPGAAATGPQRTAVGVPSAQGSQGIVVPQGAAAPQAPTAGQATTVSRVPVAAGVIRLISDRRPPPTGTETTDTTTGVNPGGIEQPAAATPAAGQNQLR